MAARGCRSVASQRAFVGRPEVLRASRPLLRSKGARQVTRMAVSVLSPHMGKGEAT